MQQHIHAYCTLVVPSLSSPLPFETFCLQAITQAKKDIQKQFLISDNDCYSIHIRQRSANNIIIRAIVDASSPVPANILALSASFFCATALFTYYELHGYTSVIQSLQTTSIAESAELLTAPIAKAPLYGLLLLGGKSTRMGKDKGTLQYNGIPYTEKTYNIMQQCCEQTYLSIRTEQQEQYLPTYSCITDTFLAFGPLSGILSALYSKRDVAWLVLPSDLPLISVETIQELIDARSQAPETALATCYYNTEDQRHEPLCTIYEPSALPRIFSLLAQGISCPSTILRYCNTHTIPLHSNALYNVNTPQEYDKACAILQNSI